MNYIKRLQLDKIQLETKLLVAMDELAQLQCYLLSPKFQGIDNDYVHVRTDLLPRLAHIKDALL